MSSGAVVTVQLVLMLLLGRMAMRVKDSQQSEALGLGLLRCLTRWRLMDSDGLPPTCLWEYQLLSVEGDIEIHFYCSVCIDVLCNFFFSLTVVAHLGIYICNIFYIFSLTVAAHLGIYLCSILS